MLPLVLPLTLEQPVVVEGINAAAAEGNCDTESLSATRKTARLGGAAAPVGNLFQTIPERMLEQPHHMPRVFKFVNVRPNLRLPREFMRLRLATGSTPGVQTSRGHPLARHRARPIRQLNKDAPDLFDFLVGADQVLITQKISEAQLSSLRLSLGARVERPVFGPQLIGRVASHPE